MVSTLTRLLAFTTVQQAGGHGQVAHMAFKEHLNAITNMQKSSFIQLYPRLTHSKPAQVSHCIMAELSVATICHLSRIPWSIKTSHHIVQPQFYKIHSVSSKKIKKHQRKPHHHKIKIPFFCILTVQEKPTLCELSKGFPNDGCMENTTDPSRAPSFHFDN